MAITLTEFKAAHAPMHSDGDPVEQFNREFPKGATRFIITAAQNSTPVDPIWWGVLNNMADIKGAHLVVIPLRYKNPTSQWTGSQQNADYWVDEVRPFLYNGRRDLNKNLTLLGDIKIQPTASSPLTGADALSLASSGIIGHTKLQLRAIPTPSNKMAKILTTTGACTVENYTDSRAGRIGEFHHSLAAVMVEIDGARFHLRQLHFDAKSGTCTDIDTTFGVDAAWDAKRALALVMGDTHVDFLDPQVENATWGIGGIVEATQPEHIVWHDTLDAYSCSPHHLGDPFISRAKQMSGRDNVRAEVRRAIEYVAARAARGHISVIVPSNHDDMLSRWVKRADWKTDPVNAEFYLALALAMHQCTRMTARGTEYPDPFTLMIRNESIPNLVALDRDQSFVLGGVELGMHGDRGPNGSRGSIRNLRRIGIRSIVGHSHSAGIDEGCYQTGTSTQLRLEYNSGPSSWLNAHVLLNADGKRQLIIIVDGKFRA